MIRLQNQMVKYEYIIRNKEIVSLRGIIPGKYLVNVHVYNKKLWMQNIKWDPVILEVVLIKLNPYSEVAYAEFVGDQVEAKSLLPFILH